MVGKTTLSDSPKLRFPEFNDEWQKKKVGDLGKLVGGGTPSRSSHKYWVGDIPWVSSSDIGDEGIRTVSYSRHITQKAVQESATKLIPANSVLVVSRVGVGKIAINDRDVCTSQDFTNVIPITVNNIFLAYLLKNQKSRLLDFNQGTSIKGFTRDDLDGLSAFIPIDAEQQKIADFLTVVDERVGGLERQVELLKEYKKGVMQKIFSQEIGFKSEDGKDFPEWEERRLGDVFERITNRNKTGNENVLTISAQEGLINQEEFFNKSVAAKDLSNYYLLSRGDFAYNKSYSRGYPMGAIKRLNNYENGVVSVLYICFRIKEGFSSDFFEQYFEFGLQNQEIEKVAQEGARNHGLLNISVSDFFSIELVAPSKEEQQKIANFLTSVDEKINLTQKELEQAKKFKQALLQQMFV